MLNISFLKLSTTHINVSKLNICLQHKLIISYYINYNQNSNLKYLMSFSSLTKKNSLC
jgi:hypothetical protein